MVRTDSDDPELLRKSKDTANRVLSMAKASFNLAFNSGTVASDSAWRKVKPFKSVTASRKVFLTDEQVGRLLDKTTGGFHTLIKAAILIGARYGELVSAKVEDFDAKDGTLWLSGKTGPRTIDLSDDAIAFFKQVSRDKLPQAALLTRDDGYPWAKGLQGRRFQTARIKAKLPRDAVFYSLRHYYISKALLAGMTTQALAENTGTSALMIDKHYAKFTRKEKRAMLNAVALGV